MPGAEPVEQSVGAKRIAALYTAGESLKQAGDTVGQKDWIGIQQGDNTGLKCPLSLVFQTGREGGGELFLQMCQTILPGCCAAQPNVGVPIPVKVKLFQHIRGRIVIKGAEGDAYKVGQFALAFHLKMTVFPIHIAAGQTVYHRLEQICLPHAIPPNHHMAVGGRAGVRDDMKLHAEITTLRLTWYGI